MQATQNISVYQLQEIIAAIFDQGAVVVRESDSDFGCSTREFVDAQALSESLKYAPGQSNLFRAYAIYYQDAKGYPFEERVTLDPEFCEGHTFRFSQAGWGLIQLQCGFRAYPTVECRIAVNSEIRAGKWYATLPELNNPELWDWDVIKKKAGRLVRLLRKLGKQAQASAAGPDATGESASPAS